MEAAAATANARHDFVIVNGPTGRRVGIRPTLPLDAEAATCHAAGATAAAGGGKKVADLRRAIILCGTASFVMSFIGSALAFNLMAAPQAAAQSGQPQEVRAAAFTLVDADGTVLASLERTPLGSGNLTLYDSAGKRRTVLSTGVVTFFNAEGSTVLRTGLPTVNTLLLDPGESSGVLPPAR